MAGADKLRKLCSGYREIGASNRNRVYVDSNSIKANLIEMANENFTPIPLGPNFQSLLGRLQMSDLFRSILKDCVTLYQSKNEAVLSLLKAAGNRKNLAQTAKKIDENKTNDESAFQKKRKLSTPNEKDEQISSKKRKISKTDDIFINSDCSKDDLFDKMKNIASHVTIDLPETGTTNQNKDSKIAKSDKEKEKLMKTPHKKKKTKKILMQSPSFNVLASKKKINKIIKAKSLKFHKPIRSVLSREPSTSFSEAEKERKRITFNRLRAKAVVQSMKIRDYRAKGPVHPFCTANFSGVSLYRSRSQYVPIYESQEFVDDWLRNLTAKITKTARQRGFVVFDEPQFNFDVDDSEPRFNFDRRPPYRTFIAKYASDGRKFGITDNDVPDYHGVFSAQVYKEKAQNLDNIFSGYLKTLSGLDYKFLCISNVKSLFLFCVDSLYGDICNSKRDMFSRDVPQPRLRIGYTSLTEEIRRLFEERGREPSRYYSWNHRDPYPYRSPSTSSSEQYLPAINGHQFNGSADSPPSMLAEIIATPLAPDFPWGQMQPGYCPGPGPTPVASVFSSLNPNPCPSRIDPRLRHVTQGQGQPQDLQPRQPLLGLPPIDSIYDPNGWRKMSA